MPGLLKRLAVAAFVVTLAPACSHPAPPSPQERAFVSRVATALASRYPTMKSAQAHGYMPISGKLDSDNTYNLSDMQFDDVSLEHPNFLWYDRSGHLVGTDYEVPKSAFVTPPHGYDVNASRWTTVDAHVHLSYTLNGKLTYAEEDAKPNLRRSHITDADLRADGFLPEGAVLNWAMYHPASWDLALWLVPNPDGPFADRNPLVK